MKKLQNRYSLDILPIVKYIKRMFTKEIITPEEYERRRKKLEEIDELRKKEIKRLADEGVDQREIAKRFKISESYVSRIVRGER